MLHILATVARTIWYTPVVYTCGVTKSVKALIAYTQRFWQFFTKKRIVSLFDRAKSKILILSLKRCRTITCLHLQEVRHHIASMSSRQDMSLLHHYTCGAAVPTLTMGRTRSPNLVAGRAMHGLASSRNLFSFS